jgi:hypothetical protein
MRVNDALAVGALDCPAQVGQILDGGVKGVEEGGEGGVVGRG